MKKILLITIYLTGVIFLMASVSFQFNWIAVILILFGGYGLYGLLKGNRRNGDSPFKRAASYSRRFLALTAVFTLVMLILIFSQTIRYDSGHATYWFRYLGSCSNIYHLFALEFFFLEATTMKEKRNSPALDMAKDMLVFYFVYSTLTAVLVFPILIKLHVVWYYLLSAYTTPLGIYCLGVLPLARKLESQKTICGIYAAFWAFLPPFSMLIITDLVDESDSSFSALLIILIGTIFGLIGAYRLLSACLDQDLSK